MLDGLRYLHHPLRASASEQYIRPSLELLQDIQRTGDIFFPKRWMDATLGGHRSPSAARTVQTFVARLPAGYPDRLRRIILSAADDLFRASTAPTLAPGFLKACCSALEQADYDQGRRHARGMDQPARAVLRGREGRQGRRDELEPRARQPERVDAPGWTRNSLRIGDVISVEGSMAKDGSNMANAKNVTLADGKKVFAGSPGAEAPQ